jgi:predicted Fe-Mo cluster-binding NifX family protein
MEFLAAFATDDGKTLNKDHFGMAKYFHVYRFSDDREELEEKRENVKFQGDESMMHGDPRKAKATSSVLQGVDVLVGRRFGPNIPRLLKKFACVVVRKDTIESGIVSIHENADRVVQEIQNGENRKHIVLS